jgi:hypothetical protein
MGSYPPPGRGASDPNRRIEEAIERIEAELRFAIDYVNDAIVPQVRREAIAAMRTAAGKLRELADRLDAAPERPADAAAPRPKDPRP